MSIFAAGRDTAATLYRAGNNAETVLTHSLNYTGRFFVVADTASFPASGLVRVGTEIVYYSGKTSTVFSGLKRGFAGSQQRPWPVGTRVAGAVMAEHHNAVKDAVINLEADLGLAATPAAGSLNGILTGLEYNFLAPKPLFRGVPRKGPPPLEVRFQNFSDAPTIRFLWEFGDGSTSVEPNPTHTYLADGVYTVRLNMITALGATGITTKTDYVVVDAEESLPFFYVTPTAGTTATDFEFVDQSGGEITSRYWVWDDGTNTRVADPDVHTATHRYLAAGRYSPVLLLVFADGTLKRFGLNDVVTVV